MKAIFSIMVLMLLLPGATAQGSGRVPATHLSVDGEVELVSNAFYINLRGYVEDIRHLDVYGENIRVEIDRDSATFKYPMDFNENESTRVIYDGPGRLASSQVRPEHNITLVAIGARTQLNIEQLDVYPHSSTKVSRDMGRAQNRENRDENWMMGPNFQIVDIGGKMHVQGDFSFAIYEWDGFVEHAGGREYFWTGEKYESLHEELSRTGVKYGGKSEWQAAYVFVQNGTLDLDLFLSDAATIYMGPAHGFAKGNISLDKSGGSETVNLEGRFKTLIEVPPPEPGLKGQASQALPQPVADSLGAEFYASFTPDTPAAEEAVPGNGSTILEPVEGTGPDAVPVSASTPSVPGSGLPSWTYLLALPALLLAAALVAYVRPIRRLHKLEDAYDLSIYDYLVENAPPLLRSRRFGAQASLMYTVALLEERGPDEAEAHLLGVRPRCRPVGATHDFLMARIRAAQTRFDEARRHVHACLEAEPAFVVEIRRNASLEFLMRPPSDPGEGYT